MLAYRLARDVGIPQSSIGIRDYVPDDRDHVFHLLSFLPTLYPRSFEWLERRLADVERKRAFCAVAVAHSRIAGILIDTPKGIRSSKISTFYVADTAGRQGVGSALLRRSKSRWCVNGVDNAYVTVARSRRLDIAPFLYSAGFVESAVLAERYGPGRDEMVYTLKLH